MGWHMLTQFVGGTTEPDRLGMKNGVFSIEMPVHRFHQKEVAKRFGVDEWTVAAETGRHPP